MVMVAFAIVLFVRNTSVPSMSEIIADVVVISRDFDVLYHQGSKHLVTIAPERHNQRREAGASRSS